jgi:pilus assembly protein CpaC
VTENVNRFPFLGEIPVLGTLFRSTEFQSDRSELLFVITPRLVRATPVAPALPTDSFRPPSRSELILKGQLEGSGRPDSPSGNAPSDGLKLK